MSGYNIDVASSYLNICQQSTVLILMRYLCSTALFFLERTSEISLNIYLICSDTPEWFSSVNCNHDRLDATNLFRMTLGLLMPLVHNCQQCATWILKRSFVPYSFVCPKRISETLPNIYLIMFRPFQIVSLCQSWPKQLDATNPFQMMLGLRCCWYTNVNNIEIKV